MAIWNNESLDDVTRLDALSVIPEKAFRSINLDSAIYYSDLLYDLALQAKLPHYQADALLHKAFDLRLKGSPNLALEALSESLAIYSKINDKRGTANVLNLTGSIYFEQGSYDESLKFLLPAVEIRER
jgi:tetratricopeptide (TPR) repeat protein